MTQNRFEQVSYLLLLGVMVHTIGINAASANDIREKLQKRVYKGPDGGELPYRLYVPQDYDPKKEYPLILFLHGAGERGNDNEKQLKHPQVLNLVTSEKAPPAFLVAPQCPTGDKWVRTPWGAKKPHATPKEASPPMKMTLAVLGKLEKEFNIDPQRRYVTGLSMGGYGTFDAVVRRPRYWAAAVPICGGMDNAKAKRIAHVPMWVFHGDQDRAVPVERSRTAVAALKAAGAEPRYTEYKGKGHFVWGPAYEEPELVTWLFAQRRK